MASRPPRRSRVRVNAGLWLIVAVVAAVFAVFVFWNPYDFEGYVRAPQTPAAAPDVGDGKIN